MQTPRENRVTLADLLDRSSGKTAKFCLGDNTYIQGKIESAQEDFLLIQRDPQTIIPMDKIIWLQFLD